MFYQTNDWQKGARLCEIPNAPEERSVYLWHYQCEMWVHMDSIHPSPGDITSKEVDLINTKPPHQNLIYRGKKLRG